ncbi:DegT/DnrJ/EryC1/StrS family aminotransferase [Pseudoalteromonas sp. L23]|uniref:DegT/DnrJ/EryC1/StrS family aminotransferase n=1 Tax=unclassified Pseudoalteromonas TaxID=194690 RepID=UPI001EF05319|nr:MULTISPECIES: DegT/DnrJ/EryC1/StrS family aminotransferase [unclassified Pseudoalteromonas]MCF7514990.1 DegT/DnrJ/EryC1/StrS family aminotransferase [Pseudoalteromonas sp. L7]MCF7527086.1 DegT/DnrJ/EryC1/StrS family aminotransferase [Pseudoalteromonas sp. L23]MCX2767494.1 DegT/DnrJ/EryC1/StrS family aminotransferase [Pseudoalteromonas sp. B530]
MVYVHKPVLPDRATFDAYIDLIYESRWLTNNGPLVQQLEKKLSQLLGCPNVILVSSGTSALEVAIHAVADGGEIITSPFSFAATSQAITYTGKTPTFADICLDTFNLCPAHVEKAINENTSAIMPVHVYGNPCNIEKFEDISSRYNIPVIYDAAHCFGVNYKGQTIFNSGTLSVTSFHATKLFHTIEGGAIFTNDHTLAERIRKIINFGIQENGAIRGIGTNAKMNEFEAAMGLSLLPKLDHILHSRKLIWDIYHKAFKDIFQLQLWRTETDKNYAYFPLVFKSEQSLINVISVLEQEGIYPRRYFYPTLDTIYNSKSLANASSISNKVLCLPIYPDLPLEIVHRTIDLVIQKGDK